GVPGVRSCWCPRPPGLPRLPFAARVRSARRGGTRCLGTSSPRAAIELDEPSFLWRRLVGAPAPGANSVVCLVARWASPPAAPRTSWCSSLPGQRSKRLDERAPATPWTSWCSSLPGICPAPCSVELHYPQFLRHAEDDVLLAAGQFGDVVGAAVAQMLDDLLHQYVGRGCAGGESYGADAFQPLRTNLVGAVDQVGGCAHAVGQFAQAVGVGGVGTANDQYQIAFAGQLLDCVLAVLGGVADVVLARAFDGRK